MVAADPRAVVADDSSEPVRLYGLIDLQLSQATLAKHAQNVQLAEMQLYSILLLDFVHFMDQLHSGEGQLLCKKRVQIERAKASPRHDRLVRAMSWLLGKHAVDRILECSYSRDSLWNEPIVEAAAHKLQFDLVSSI